MENSELYQFLSNTNHSFFPKPESSTMQQSFSASFSSYPLEPFHAPPLQDKALAALRNHKEAEKRRRERINAHLNKLRTLLPCNSKTDKASLLAKVVERLRELKQRMSEITNSETFPSETDEISVLSTSGDEGGGDGRVIFRASLCCEDRSDLIPDLVEILKSLHLTTLKAEIATLGGRTRNVLVVATDKDHGVESIHFLHSSLNSLLQHNATSKRRRLVGPKFIA
ncbi:transcription factor bHLH106-like [Vigna unguiculata]|uniref:transcription factor bHLH106-like n=1 Tax=Vigna unguiculata TaxID=3917 RepID=UPI0010160896|nr:transcription factor bHLH106-like [Vigna unguiculata]